MGIIQMSITASILILVIVVIRALAINKLPKKTFVILWGLALLRLLIPFSISLPFNINLVTDKIMETQTTSPNIIRLSNMYAVNDLFEPVILDGATQISPAVFVWIIGIIICALFFLVTHFRCRWEYKAALPIDNAFIIEWLKRHKTRRSIQIRQTDILNTPMTYGIWKPVILLPKTTDWRDETGLRYVLTHELIHIKRFDILSKWLLAIALCLHWYNPLVWVMYILANRDIELSCDENVVLTFGETIKSAYALSLIRLEEKKSGFSPLFNNFAKNAIEERITSIMKMKKVSLIGVISTFVLVSILTVVVLAASATNANNQADSSLTYERLVSQSNEPNENISYRFEPGIGVKSETNLTQATENSSRTDSYSYEPVEDISIELDVEPGLTSKDYLTRARENSLRTNLLNFEGIDDAQVMLVIDETSSSDIFMTINNSSADIMITSNREISKDEATKMATLISKSVEGLQTKNIQIIDQNGNVLFPELE